MGSMRFAWMGAFAVMVAQSGTVGAQPKAKGASKKPVLVVVQGKTKGSPSLKRDVSRLVEKPLDAEFQLVPVSRYRKAVVKAGFKGSEITSMDAIPKAGKRVGAEFVLVIESTRDITAGGGKKAFAAEVSLLKVATGAPMFGTSYPLSGRKLSADAASQIVAEVLKRAKPEPVAEPEVAPIAAAVPAEAPPAAAEPLPVENPPVVAEAAPAPAAETTPPVEEPVSAEPTVETTASAEQPAEAPTAPEEATASAPVETEPAVTETAEEPENDVADGRRRPWLRAVGGPMTMRRVADITAVGATPPGYEGTFAGIYIEGEFYPLGMLGIGPEAVQSIGVFTDIQFYQINTELSSVTSQEIDSSIFGIGGGLTYRYVIGDDEDSPDVVGRVGMRNFQYPLREGAFPGVRYSNILVGATLNWPLLLGLSAVGSFEVYPVLGLGGKVPNQLGSEDGGLGFQVQAGGRFTLGIIHVSAMFRFEQLNADFSGRTSIPAAEAVQQYQNVSFSDRYIGGLIAGGVVF